MHKIKIISSMGVLLIGAVFFVPIHSQNTMSDQEPQWQCNLASDSISWASEWKDDSARTDSVQYLFENGSLRFWTETGTRQRPKITHKNRNFTSGQYSWRVYVPQMGLYNQASIGAFLYRDGDHELDFEIGSGKKHIRDSVNAQDDEVVMYLTSQAFPVHQSIHPIKIERWYDLSMKLSETNDGKYYVEWLLDDKLVDAVKLEYGPEVKFGIHCSLENIDFIGDVYATQNHYCLFKSVGYKPFK